MNLTQFTARVREDLKDTDAANYLWTTDEVEGAILRAVDEYSRAAPIQQRSDIATVTDSVEIDISSLTGLLSVESVEFPIGELPAYTQHFRVWASTIYMQDKGDGTNARIKWTKKHTVAAGSTTVPTENDEVIVLGATGYLAMSASAYIVDKATISGRWGTQNYRLWGRERLERFQNQLKSLPQVSPITGRQLYTDD